MDVEDTTNPIEMFGRLHGDVRFCWNRSTFEAALHMVLWMGACRVHFVGTDFSAAQGDYCDGMELSPAHKKKSAHCFARQLRSMAHLAIEASVTGIRFVSCTPDSPLNAMMEYVPLAEAVAASGARVPRDDDAPILLGTQPEACLWQSAPANGREVVVVVDAATACRLPEWWGTYAQANRYAVLFVDVGIAEGQWVDWCKAHGGYINAKRYGLREGWAIPTALLHGSRRKLLALTPDVAVGDDLAATFEAIPADGLLVGDMVGCHHGDTTIERWAERMFDAMENGVPATDVLASLASTGTDQVALEDGTC